MRRRSRSIFYLVGPIARARRKEDTKRAKKERKSTHGGESVGGVGDKHAGLADGAVADRHALDEPCRAHRPPSCFLLACSSSAAVGCGGCLPGLGWSGGYGQVMQGY